MYVKQSRFFVVLTIFILWQIQSAVVGGGTHRTWLPMDFYTNVEKCLAIQADLRKGETEAEKVPLITTSWVCLPDTIQAPN